MRFMKMALRLAKLSQPFPNPRVGAVLVRGGKVIGEGHHRRAGLPHAEIEAIEDARRRSGDRDAVSGATLYVSLEPCSHRMKRTPPCTEAIIAAGIRRVVFGMSDPNPLVSGAAVLRAAGVEVEGPVATREGEAINQRYIRSVSSRPYVAIKMAMSADGKTATRTGDSKHRISGPEERLFVHRMRNDYDVVMVGAGTVITDDPKLTCRISGGRDPIRVIIDGRLRIPMGADVLRRDDGKTIIATTSLAPKRKVEAIARGTSAHVFVCGGKEVDLRALVGALGAMGARKIMIEGGSELNAKALGAGIVDRLYLSIAPKIIGGRGAKGVVGGVGIEKLSQAIRLGNLKVKRLGKDLLLQYDVIRPG
jgi:diaminohydroxyphosphoribosylaminopyrimidine deaminase/5-amino-6-(5-phosphoribosylamino)uracil reductase